MASKGAEQRLRTAAIFGSNLNQHDQELRRPSAPPLTAGYTEWHIARHRESVNKELTGFGPVSGQPSPRSSMRAGIFFAVHQAVTIRAPYRGKCSTWFQPQVRSGRNSPTWKAARPPFFLPITRACSQSQQLPKRRVRRVVRALQRLPGEARERRYCHVGRKDAFRQPVKCNPFHGPRVRRQRLWGGASGPAA